MSKKGKGSKGKKDDRKKVIKNNKPQQPKIQSSEKLPLANQWGKSLNKAKKNEGEMRPQIDFVREIDEKSNSLKITGKTQYQWFLIEFSLRVSMEKKQLIEQCQKAIEKRLYQVDSEVAIMQKCSEWSVFVKNVWVINQLTLTKHNFDYEQKQTQKAIMQTTKQQPISQPKSIKKIVCYMSESYAKELFLKCNQSHILLMLSHASFKNLKVLDINCLVESLEPLGWMDCVYLTTLSIHYTNVSSIKPLEKLYTLRMHTLKILNNKIADMGLSRIRMRKGGSLIVFRMSAIVKSEEIQMQDLAKIVKAEVRLNGVRVGSKLIQNRIRSKVIDRLVQGGRWVNREMVDEEEQSESDDQWE